MSKQLEFPHKFKDLTDEEKQISFHHDDFGGLKKVDSTKYCVPIRLENHINEIYNFQPRKDDIWLIGSPRSGTTLLQEILYLLGTDLNYEKAASKIMDDRFPYIEQFLAWTEKDMKSYHDFLKTGKSLSTSDVMIPHHVKLANTEKKRFIKSHLGFDFLHPSLLEVGCKVVYIARNIKDCLVSLNFYPSKQKRASDDATHIHNMLQYYKRNVEPFGSYFELLKAAWKRRNNKNLLFLYYEDVIADKEAAVIRIADFLSKKLTESQLSDLLNHINVESFKNNKSLNNDYLVDSGLYIKTEKYSFIRQGKTGRWRDIFTKEMNEEIDEWIKSSLNEIPDFKMPECWKQAMDME